MAVDAVDCERIRKSELRSILKEARRTRPLIRRRNLGNLLFTKDDDFDLSGVEFKECVFPGTTFFEVRLDGTIFEDCKFTEDAKFYRSGLLSVRFAKCDPMDVSFDESNLSKVAFRECALHNADFVGAELYKTRLSSADFADKSRPRLTKTRIRQECDGNWAEAAEVYRLLKENFASLANYGDASWAHFKEMQMLRKGQDHWWRIALELVNEITWGYGEKPERPLFFGIGIIILWTLIYWALDSAFGGIPGAKDIWDYLLFSSASFVTLSFSGLEASAMWAQALSTLEAAFGVITLSMFTFAIGQRVSGR